jgi:hypothetical protein
VFSSQKKIHYSLRSILLFYNMDVSIIKICLDTPILAKSIMDRKEYKFSQKPLINMKTKS